ncbi:hypothetical protein SDC9_181296 [bioreactor metagenome]|uniref:Uncharacterized protein n=1 Tax=bioreactor metagenome TaxID=1076179 RepID=A0A645HCI7_9ZZZZ
MVVHMAMHILRAGLHLEVYMVLLQQIKIQLHQPNTIIIMVLLVYIIRLLPVQNIIDIAMFMLMIIKQNPMICFGKRLLVVRGRVVTLEKLYLI